MPCARRAAQAGAGEGRSQVVPISATWERRPSEVIEKIGAGEGNRTLVISLEGCCSTIELHPRKTTFVAVTFAAPRLAGQLKRRSAETPRLRQRLWRATFAVEAGLPTEALQGAKAGGRGRTRTCEGVSQRIYSPPPLPLGTLSQTVASH